MEAVSLISWLGACVAIFVAAFEWPFGSVPRYRAERWHSLIAGLSGLFVLCTALQLMTWPTTTVLLVIRLQVAAGAVVSYGWLRYSRVHEQTAPSAFIRWLERALLVSAALSFTGLFQTGLLAPAPYPPAGSRYLIASPTPLGAVAYCGILIGIGISLRRFWVASRKGVPYARPHAAALLVLLAAGINDAVATVGVPTLPYLLTLGLFAEVIALGIVASLRWAEDARRAEELSSSLERLVESRTVDLRSAQGALERSERLAALGRMAAGVAHEINNPAAVIAANLEYMREAIARGDLANPEVKEALEDAATGVARIARIVRQLLASVRGTSQGAIVSFDVSAALALAARHAALDPSVGLRAAVEARDTSGLFAFGEPGLVEQILANLIRNGAQAMPVGSRGLVTLSAARNGNAMEIIVTDDGAGISSEVRGHLFEPFFSTKPFGEGTGLGLPVSLGLVRGMGGDLSFESEPGLGTTMTMTLRAAEAPAMQPAGPARLSSPAHPPEKLRSLLVIDDEPRVREALRRSLSGSFALEMATGVEDAWAKLAKSSFDLVLCDVMMPGGGAPELWNRLREIRSPATGRMIFFTGGATTTEASAFLAAQEQPVLEKPLDLAALFDAARLLKDAVDARAATR